MQIVSTDDYMPMPINNLEEYDKVVNVSWYTPDKIREELKYDIPEESRPKLIVRQVPLRTPFLSDVPSMLYRYPELPEPVLLLLR